MPKARKRNQGINTAASTLYHLSRRAPPPINRRAVLFPMGKLVKNDKIDVSKTDDFIAGLGKQFNIWDKYGIRVENMKKDSKKPFIPNIFNLK